MISMYVALFLHLIFTSLVINGIDLAADTDYIFHPVRVWADKHLPSWIYRPLIGCVVCMTSVYGTISWAAACVLIFKSLLFSLVGYLPFIFALAYVNLLVSNFTNND